LDELIIQNFDKSFSEMSADEFIELIVNNLNLKKIIVGYNHRFGKNRSADIQVLKKFSLKYNFEVIEIKAFEIEKIEISSTKIRDSINDGNIDICNNYLGYNFNINGEVVKGKKIGKSIGFPTANIRIDEKYKILPKNGVYIVACFVDAEKYYGMLNIGYNPTFGLNKKTIEVNIFDFDKDLYGKILKIDFLKFIRNEIKFDNAEMLQNRLLDDRENCINYINSTFNN
jgi:riboflavin kinase/FMN adenylyltransferase